MITQIRGKLLEKYPTHVIVDCNGIGYFINISLNTFSNLKDQENILLYIHFLVKEDAHILYGFNDKNEREIFRLLISVSGVGPSIARTMLSSMKPEQIQQAIALEDVQVIQSVKGIGGKTAKRVILDLKDKILKTYILSEESSTTNNTLKNEALSALEILGFTKKQSEKIVVKVIAANPQINLENVIKQALKTL